MIVKPIKYRQTWKYVSRLRRFPLVGPVLVKAIQSFCGLYGHEKSRTEWGYGGGEMADVWCRWCNYRWQIPYSDIMDKIDPEVHKVVKDNFFH